MTHLLTKNWLDSCVDSLDLPGSPWHSAKSDVLKRLAEKLEEKHLFAEAQQVSHELGDTKSILFINPIKNKMTGEKAATKEKMVKAFLSIAAREAGYSANADRSNQTQSCAELIGYIQNVLKVNYESFIMPAANSMHSDDKMVVEQREEVKTLGAVLAQVLKNDPRQLYKVSLRLKNCVIPDTLRKSFYQLTLQKIAQDSYGAAKNDEMLRQEFADKVKSGMTKLGIKDPTKSTVRHMIQTAIIESYETIPSLTIYSKDMKFQKSSSEILNIMYTSTKKFKYEYILWLFPLHVAAQDDGSKEHMFELAMQLDRFTSCCFEISNINKILLDIWTRLIASKLEKVQKVMQRFQSIGIELSIDQVQFLLQQDMGTATENAAYPSDIFRHGLNALNSKSLSKSLFAVPHPILCIRQWIRCLFVGSTAFPVTMFLFDQFFLYFWDHEAIVKACLCFVCLLSDSIVKSANVEQVCTKMLMETKLAEATEFKVMWKHVLRNH